MPVGHSAIRWSLSSTVSPLWPPAIAGWLIVAACGSSAGVAQDASAPKPPVGNEAFAELVTRGRLPHNFEMYNPHSEAELRAVKEMGFTQVILDNPSLHTLASKIGLDVVMANWWTLETETEVIEKGVEKAKQVDRRRLAAVSMMDEPERYAPQTPFSFYQALYKNLRAHFDQELPGVKLEISHWGPLRSWTEDAYQYFVPLYQATDRIRLMPYPDLYESPLNEVYYQMVRSRRVMQLAERDLPQVVILQTWVLPEKPKLPTIDELRVMAYQAMLVGADTLSFYNYDVKTWQQTEGFTAGFTELMKELTTFCRHYREASVESRMSADGVLTATLSVPDEAPTLIVVNTNREPVEGLEAFEVAIRSSSPSDVPASKVRCTPRRRFLLFRRRSRSRW